MRRKDRAVTDPAALQQIMEDCKVCRLAMSDRDGLYLVPLNFGYSYVEGQLTLFFHSAKAGRKLDALRENNAVAFEMDCGHRLVTGDAACDYAYSFQSIIGTGRVSFATSAAEKKLALGALMRHQTGRDFVFDDAAVEAVCTFSLTVDSFCGKCHA